MSTVRARVGLIKPSDSNVPYWKQLAPEGVEIVPTYLGYQRGDRETFERGFQRAEELALGLKADGCNIIAFLGTPPSLLAGLDYERRWRQDLATKLGVPVITAMEPHALALQALGARKVAVATYYGDELNQAITKYLARFDIEAAMLGGFSLTDEREELFTTPMQTQRGITPEQVYDYCVERFGRIRPHADALYINGGAWNVPSVIDRLEQDLDTKVVWGTVAEMWLIYWTLGIAFSAPSSGSLIRDRYEPLEGVEGRRK